MVDREDLRRQFTDAFEDADYPVRNQMDLVPSLPNGPGTRFESGDFSMSALELATTLADQQEFPYDSVDALVDDIMVSLERKDLL